MSSVKGALDARVASIQMAADNIDPSALTRMAERAATAVHRAAAGHGEQIGVAVEQRKDGVRVVVRGPRAARYRQLLKTAVDKQMSETKESIRDSIVRGLKQ